MIDERSVTFVLALVVIIAVLNVVIAVGGAVHQRRIVKRWESEVQQRDIDRVLGITPMGDNPYTPTYPILSDDDWRWGLGLTRSEPVRHENENEKEPNNG